MSNFRFLFLCVTTGLAGALIGNGIPEGIGLGLAFLTVVMCVDALCDAIRGKPQP